MTRKLRLTDRAVARLPAMSGEYTAWDTRITALGVRVRPSGHKSFVLLDNSNGSSKRRTLGPVTRMSVDEARSRSLAIQSGAMDLPKEVSPVSVPLFGDFVRDIWRPECFDHFKPSTRRRIRSALSTQLLPAFGDMPLHRITQRDVMAWFDRYSERAQAAPTGISARFGRS